MRVNGAVVHIMQQRLDGLQHSRAYPLDRRRIPGRIQVECGTRGAQVASALPDVWFCRVTSRLIGKQTHAWLKAFAESYYNESRKLRTAWLKPSGLSIFAA